MKNSWSKEDRFHYDNSEVMKELEANVLSTISRLDLITKKSQDATETSEKASAQQKLNTELAKTVDLTNQLNAADDQEQPAEYSDDDIAIYLMSSEHTPHSGRYKGYNGNQGPNPLEKDDILTELSEGGAYHHSRDNIVSEMRANGVQSLSEASADGHTVIIQDNQAHDEEVKEAALEELRELVVLAVEKGNYKLAYKIERTIDEITEEEVSCEL